jgi:NitT/TauT family transport system substrate-binding protein
VIRGITRAQALAALAAATAACATAANAQTAPLIRLGGSGTDLYIEPFIAQDAGFFARAGLNVEVTPLANGGAIAAAVAGGALDAGLADMIQIANAVNRGVPFAFFAGGGLYATEAPILALCVAKSGPVRGARDLNGQTVALVALKSITEAAVREWLRVNGADVGTIKFFEMPYAEMAPALARGTLAAAFIGEPFLSAARDDVRILGRSYDAVAPSFYISAWFGSRDWIGKNPELVRRLTQALYDTARWADGHHNESAPILAKYAKLDVDRIRAMNRTRYATSLDPKLMQPVLDVALKYQLIEKPLAAADLMVKLPA